MIKKLLSLDYEKRIEFMEKNCVNGNGCGITRILRRCSDEFLRFVLGNRWI